MTTRFKLVAAVLGLAVATAAIGDASATTIVKSFATHAAGKTKTTMVIRHAPHRVIVGKRIVRQVRVVRRAPVLVKVARVAAPVKVVRVVKHPLLQRQALAHRVIVKKTIIR